MTLIYLIYSCCSALYEYTVTQKYKSVNLRSQVIQYKLNKLYYIYIYIEAISLQESSQIKLKITN